MPRSNDAPRQNDEYGGDAKRDIERADLSGYEIVNRSRHAEAAGSERYLLPIEEHPLSGLREGQGRKSEIETKEPQCRQRNRSADDTCQRRAGWNGGEKGPTEMDLQQPGSVSPDAEYRRV